MNLAERIDQLLKNDGREAKVVAAAAGLSPGTLTNWRQGDRSPNVEELYRLTQILGVSLGSLFGEDPATMLLREVPSEALIDDALKEVDDLREKVEAVNRAVRRIKQQVVSSSPISPVKAGVEKAVASVEKPGVVYGRSRKAASPTGKTS